MKIPECAEFWTLDEIAECTAAGSNKELYRKLWSLMPSDAEMGPAPDEDHWTGGPAEYRSSNRPSQIKYFWDKFTEEEQAALAVAMKGEE